MTPDTHLSDEERHGVADGSLSPERLAVVETHLKSCAECAADVARIRAFLSRVDDAMDDQTLSPAAVEELWPSIRSRIEQRKIVAMPAAGGTQEAVAPLASRPSRRPSPQPFRRAAMIVGGLVAAGLVLFVLARGRLAPVASPPIAMSIDSGSALVPVVDSTNAYQKEAQQLLNRLELERATLRPELAQALERDLRTIDLAIAELRAALRDDPTNPALRLLLASSYRQKVDLLKRASNAS